MNHRYLFTFLTSIALLLILFFDTGSCMQNPPRRPSPTTGVHTNVLKRTWTAVGTGTEFSAIISYSTDLSAHP
jgi:hypothetical protein